MNIRRIAAITTLLLMWHTPNAKAASAEGGGIKLCADVMHGYKNDPHFGEDFYFSWAEGFMSGLTIAKLNDEPNAFNAMPIEQQKAHIRSFCDANPTKQYFYAVIDLYATIYPKRSDK